MQMMTGFPPTEESRVTLANWQSPASVRWAFRHMREIIPTQVIAGRLDPVAPLETREDRKFHEVALRRLSGAQSSVEDVIDDTWTDALLILHDGALVTERYYAGCTE